MTAYKYIVGSVEDLPNVMKDGSLILAEGQPILIAFGYGENFYIIRNGHWTKIEAAILIEDLREDLEGLQEMAE